MDGIPQNNSEQTGPTPTSMSAGVSTGAASFNRDLARRALDLEKLGNSPEQIRRVLSSLPGASPDEIEDILRRLKARQTRKQNKILRATYFIVIGIFLLAGLVALFASQPRLIAMAAGQKVAAGKKSSGSSQHKSSGTPIAQRPGQPAQPLPSPTSSGWWEDFTRALGGSQAVDETQSDDPNQEEQAVSEGDQYLDPSILPAAVQTAIPDGAKILKPPDVVVRQLPYTGRLEGCPQSSGEAAKLFGGHMKLWSKGMGGWTMISTEPITVTIPEGMSAGYLVFIQRPEFYSVLGPVEIQNINFLAISCQ